MGLSQAALAHKLDVTERTVARWEKGAIHPPLTAEATLRLLYQEKAGERVDVEGSLRLMAEAEEHTQRLDLVEDDGWSEAA